MSKQLGQPGQAALGQWSPEADTHTQAQVRTQHREAIQRGKKNLKWQSSFGWITVAETQWRPGKIAASVLRAGGSRAAGQFAPAATGAGGRLGA